MNKDAKHVKTIIIGAGITGLCLSHYIKDSDFLVFESKGEVGGKIKTEKRDGCLFENGPNSLMLRNNDVKDLIVDLQLLDSLQMAEKSSASRYLAKGSELVKITPGNLATKILDFAFLRRLLTLTYTSKSSNPNECVYDFFERKLGKSFADYVITPFVSGIYAGDPKKLLIKSAFKSLAKLEEDHNSLIVGAIKSKKSEPHKLKSGIASFKHGLMELCEKLFEQSKDNIHCDHTVQAISKVDKIYHLTVNDENFSCDNLVITTPAYNAKDICKDFLPHSFLESLSNINYPWLMVAQVLIPKSEIGFADKGFGFLQIPDSKSKVLGCLFSTHMFPQRAKEGFELFTCFVGGTKNAHLKDLGNRELHNQIVAYLTEVLSVKDASKIEIDSVSWEKAIPQYDKDQLAFSLELEKVTECHDNLHFCTNYVGGVSLPDCISNAKILAKQLV
ncbi:MAG: protoporphyrinogen oxidase [Candidatus Cloacimonetes bacterium]|nr:protoporphyrinogen oxidase [Candidatus Cloacimonadota bacterium]